MDQFFFTQIKKGQMKWTLDRDWLTVYYQETLSASGANQKFSLLCAQSLNDYTTVFQDGAINIHLMELLSRIHTMLFEALRSAKQDVNILMSER